MDKKIIKPHGMTSDKAWRVKTRGNRKEDIFARLIDGTQSEKSKLSEKCPNSRT